MTPLHLAIHSADHEPGRKLDTVKLLLENGADPEIESEAWGTSRDFAKQMLAYAGKPKADQEDIKDAKEIMGILDLLEQKKSEQERKELEATSSKTPIKESKSTTEIVEGDSTGEGRLKTKKSEKSLSRKFLDTIRFRKKDDNDADKDEKGKRKRREKTM
jgi:hypothetical protein